MFKFVEKTHKFWFSFKKRQPMRRVSSCLSFLQLPHPVFCLFVIIFPFEEDLVHYLKKKIGISFIHKCFVPSLIEIGVLDLVKIFFISVYFYSFAIISPWRRGLTFI
jgi:hypothetical protein